MAEKAQENRRIAKLGNRARWVFLPLNNENHGSERETANFSYMAEPVKDTNASLKKGGKG